MTPKDAELIAKALFEENEEVECCRKVVGHVAK
jgi:hypothetical protein